MTVNEILEAIVILKDTLGRLYHKITSLTHLVAKYKESSCYIKMN